MTNPHQFTAVTAQEKRDPSEFIPWMRCVEVMTPRGLRPGKLMVVRPTSQVEDWRQREGRDPNAWRGKLTIADIAVLDAIPPSQDEYGNELPGFQAGHQFRDQTVFPGFLNKAFRDYVGATLIGVTYLGPNEKGKPPILWRDLSGDPAAVQRGQSFLMARPEFLIPVQAQFTSQQQPDQWAQPASQQQQGYPQARPQQNQNYQQASPVRPPEPWSTHWAVAQDAEPQATVAAAMQMAQQPPVQEVWHNAPSYPASAPPAQQTQAAPPPAMTSLDQLRQQAASVNHHNQPQTQDPPF